MSEPKTEIRHDALCIVAAVAPPIVPDSEQPILPFQTTLEPVSAMKKESSIPVTSKSDDESCGPSTVDNHESRPREEAPNRPEPSQEMTIGSITAETTVATSDHGKESVETVSVDKAPAVEITPANVETVPIDQAVTITIDSTMVPISNAVPTTTMPITLASSLMTEKKTTDEAQTVPINHKPLSIENLFEVEDLSQIASYNIENFDQDDNETNPQHAKPVSDLEKKRQKKRQLLERALDERLQKIDSATSQDKALTDQPVSIGEQKDTCKAESISQQPVPSNDATLSRQDLEMLTQETASLKRKLEKVTDECQQYKEKVAKYEHGVQLLETEVTQSNKNRDQAIKKHQEDLAQVELKNQEQIKALNAKYHALKVNYEKARQDVDQKRKDRDEARDQTDKLREALAEKEKIVSHLEKKYSEASNEASHYSTLLMKVPEATVRLIQEYNMFLQTTKIQAVSSLLASFKALQDATCDAHNQARSNLPERVQNNYAQLMPSASLLSNEEIQQIFEATAPQPFSETLPNHTNTATSTTSDSWLLQQFSAGGPASAVPPFDHLQN